MKLIVFCYYGDPSTPQGGEVKREVALPVHWDVDSLSETLDMSSFENDHGRGVDHGGTDEDYELTFMDPCDDKAEAELWAQKGLDHAVSLLKQ